MKHTARATTGRVTATRSEPHGGVLLLGVKVVPERGDDNADHTRDE